MRGSAIDISCINSKQWVGIVDKTPQSVTDDHLTSNEVKPPRVIQQPAVYLSRHAQKEHRGGGEDEWR